MKFRVREEDGRGGVKLQSLACTCNESYCVESTRGLPERNCFVGGSWAWDGGLTIIVTLDNLDNEFYLI